MKNKNSLIKTVISGLLVALILCCNSRSENFKEKIKPALDNYHQITNDYESYMRQMAQDNPGQISLQSELNSAKNTCLRLNGIDVSETPPDFQTAFKKRISLECDSLNSLADQVTYEGDPKTKAVNNAIRELEDVSAKYGYTYKNSKTAK